MFKYKNRGISTLVAIGIIAVLIVVVGGGVFAYQYFSAQKNNNLQQTPNNQQAQNQNNQNDSGTITCVDSDGGTNYYVAGQAKIINNSPNQQFLDDECRGNTLIEADCSNGRITSTTYACPNSCLNGACINSKLSINVTSPNGGEIWKVGETHNITWTSSLPQNSRVLIYLSKAGSNYDYTIATGISASLGTYPWTIPATVGGGNTSSISTIGDQWKVLIEYPASSGFDTSDNYFTIASANQIISSLPKSYDECKNAVLQINDKSRVWPLCEYSVAIDKTAYNECVIMGGEKRPAVCMTCPGCPCVSAQCSLSYVAPGFVLPKDYDGCVNLSGGAYGGGGDSSGIFCTINIPKPEKYNIETMTSVYNDCVDRGREILGDSCSLKIYKK